MSCLLETFSILFGFFFPSIFTNQRKRKLILIIFYYFQECFPNTRKYYPGHYCRGLSSAHSQWPISNRKPLFPTRESLNTKLTPLKKYLRHSFPNTPLRCSEKTSMRESLIISKNVKQQDLAECFSYV